MAGSEMAALMSADEWAPPGGIVAYIRDRIAEGWSDQQIEAALRRRRQEARQPRPAQRHWQDVDDGHDAEESDE